VLAGRHIAVAGVGLSLNGFRHQGFQRYHNFLKAFSDDVARDMILEKQVGGSIYKPREIDVEGLSLVTLHRNHRGSAITTSSRPSPTTWPGIGSSRSRWGVSDCQLSVLIRARAAGDLEQSHQGGVNTRLL
jgi:hypothetical protein